MTDPPRIWAVVGIPVIASVTRTKGFPLIIDDTSSAIFLDSGMNAVGATPVDNFDFSPNRPRLSQGILLYS